jgi:hypothetical protein
MTPDLINAVARLMREMPRNPSAIAVDEALKALLAKPAPVAAAKVVKKTKRGK